MYKAKGTLSRSLILVFDLLSTHYLWRNIFINYQMYFKFEEVFFNMFNPSIATTISKSEITHHKL